MSQHDNVIILRRASTADRAAVMALVPRLVEFGPPKWRDIATMTATDVTVIGEALLSASKSPAVYVAKLDGELAGFIHLHSVTDYYRRREHGHVADIVVSERAEGRGVASRFLRRLRFGRENNLSIGSQFPFSMKTDEPPVFTSALDFVATLPGS
jgi:GNAT superfamily N-acetyltransferase